MRGGPFHSQNPEAAFLHTPGPQDRLPGHRAGRQGADQGRHPRRRPVLFFEHKYLYRRIKEHLPAGDHVVPDRQGAGGAGGEGPVDHHLRRHGVQGARGGRAAGEGGRAVGRGARPAHAAADGRRGDRGHGEEDQPRADRARGHAHRRRRRRDHGADQRAGVRVARRAGAARDGARRAAALRADAGRLRAAADETTSCAPAPLAGRRTRNDRRGSHGQVSTSSCPRWASPSPRGRCRAG